MECAKYALLYDYYYYYYWPKSAAKRFRIGLNLFGRFEKRARSESPKTVVDICLVYTTYVCICMSLSVHDHIVCAG